VEKLKLNPPEDIGKFIVKLNSASVATRYPESLEIINANYSQDIADGIIHESEKALEWIKQKY